VVSLMQTLGDTANAPMKTKMTETIAIASKR
jgi:hypothetical protein